MAFIRYLQSLKLPSFLTQLPRFQKKPPIGLYNLHVVSLEEELEFLHLLPKELRYALQKNPSLKNRIAKILKSGKATLLQVDSSGQIVHRGPTHDAPTSHRPLAALGK